MRVLPLCADCGRPMACPHPGWDQRVVYQFHPLPGKPMIGQHVDCWETIDPLELKQGPVGWVLAIRRVAALGEGRVWIGRQRGQPVTLAQLDQAARRLQRTWDSERSLREVTV